MQQSDNGGIEAPIGRRGRRSRARGKMGVAQSGLVGPGGKQLQSRVSSGAITQQQADRTLQQRQTLEKAFGPNWRVKVFGDRGLAQRTRKGLANNPDSARFKALQKKLLERRQSMLQGARKKNQEGAEG